MEAVEEMGLRVRVERFEAGHSPFLSMPLQMVAAVEWALGYQACWCFVMDLGGVLDVWRVMERRSWGSWVEKVL